MFLSFSLSLSLFLSLTLSLSLSLSLFLPLSVCTPKVKEQKKIYIYISDTTEKKNEKRIYCSIRKRERINCAIEQVGKRARTRKVKRGATYCNYRGFN